jgi:hypothetical protein
MFSNWLAALKSNRASVAVQTGLVLIALIGMVALGTEMVFLLYKHRQMQYAADAAATGAVAAILAGTPSDFHTEALAIAANAGFTDGVDGVSVTATIVDLPDGGSGVQVIVAQPQTLGLVNLFRSGIFDVGARAVAKADIAASYCILALDPSASGALQIRNNAKVVNPDCGVAVNSSSASALQLNNNSAIYGPVHVHGGVTLANGATVNQNVLQTNAAAIDDPYADRSIQTPPACTSQSGTVGNSATKNYLPGHFCSGWNFGNGAIVNLAAGSYYIDAKLQLGNNNVITGTGGVTLIINGNYAVNISNGAHLTLTAPSSGPYSGIAIMGGRTATSTVSHVFSNNASINVFGAIYFPNQIIDFQNNGATGNGRCTEVIGRIVYVSNNVALDDQCSGGVLPIESSKSRLIQ